MSTNQVYYTQFTYCTLDTASGRISTEMESADFSILQEASEFHYISA